MKKWQPIAQPVATLVLAGAVVFLGYQKGPTSPASVVFPNDVSVSIEDMPGIEVSIPLDVPIRNWMGDSFKVSGCGD